MGKSASKEQKTPVLQTQTPNSVQRSPDDRKNSEREKGRISLIGTSPVETSKSSLKKKGSDELEIPLVHRKRNEEQLQKEIVVSFNKTSEAQRKKELKAIYDDEASTLRGESSTWMLQKECDNEDDAFIANTRANYFRNRKTEGEAKGRKKMAPRRPVDYSVVYKGDYFEVVSEVNGEAAVHSADALKKEDPKWNETPPIEQEQREAIVNF